MQADPFQFVDNGHEHLNAVVLHAWPAGHKVMQIEPFQAVPWLH
jgi:hypothetical protein